MTAKRLNRLLGKAVDRALDAWESVAYGVADACEATAFGLMLLGLAFDGHKWSEVDAEFDRWTRVQAALDEARKAGWR